jgi:dTDP-4-amino-4,6-dideoxygalactose transaminase
VTQNQVPVIDLRRQHDAMRTELDAALARVIDSGWFMGGPEVKAFEQEYAAYCGREHCVALGTGTASLNLALRAAGVGPGDEVVTVSFTLSATLDAILELGATPVLVDIDPYTYTMDAHAAKKAIGSKTKAVLPVHIYGHPADLDAIAAAADGLPVIADACEAHGARYKGRPVTEYATASCFSFYPTKNLNALGDAGGVVTGDATIAGRLRELRSHGWDRRFHSAESALNSRMDEIHAAVLRLKLGKLDAWNARRAEIARRYDAALAGTDLTPSPRAEWALPSYYLYVVLSPRRDETRKALADAGIATDVHWPEPPHLQPAFAHLGYGRGSLPVTERLCDEVITLPMFPELTDAEVDRVCDALGA